MEYWLARVIYTGAYNKIIQALHIKEGMCEAYSFTIIILLFFVFLSTPFVIALQEVDIRHDPDSI